MCSSFCPSFMDKSEATCAQLNFPCHVNFQRWNYRDRICRSIGNTSFLNTMHQRIVSCLAFNMAAVGTRMVSEETKVDKFYCMDCGDREPWSHEHVHILVLSVFCHKRNCCIEISKDRKLKVLLQFCCLFILFSLHDFLNNCRSCE